MMRFARLPLAAAALGLLLACQGDSSTPIGAPLADFSDGAHDGNPDFFFLPPLFKNPSSDPRFEPSAFNAHLKPVVEICELTVSFACVAGLPLRRFETAELSLAGQHYQVNWNTDESNLDLTKSYRISVIVGTTVLGYADVDPVGTGKELRSVETGEFIGLVDGRTLPIKFRIERAALCEGVDPCNSKTIVLADGGTVVLEETGDRIDIPEQNSGQIVTVTLTLCGVIDVDLPTFGNCLTVTSDPPLAQQLEPRATVSMCSISIDEVPLPAPPQDDLLTMYRQDNGDIFALPHADDFCEQPIGSAPSSLFGQFARALGRLVAPRPLHATVAVLDVGEGGSTETFSDFQFVLPAQMFPLEGTDGQTAEPGSPVANPPGVRVTDKNGAPVVGATVRFLAAKGSGTLDLGSVVACRSDATRSCVGSDVNGIARVASWTLGSEVGAQSVTASGRGIADPGDEGGPFMPPIFGDPEQNEAQNQVPVGTGEVVFTATAIATGSISGFVRDFNTNAPIGGATVRLFSPSPSAALVGTVVTGADGVFQFGNLPPGEYSDEVTGPTGYGTSVGHINVFSGQVTQPILLLLPTGGISVIVMDAGTTAPIEDATVSLNRSASKQTDNTGRAHFNNLSAGSYVVGVSSAGYVAASQTVTVGAVATTVQFELQPLEPILAYRHSEQFSVEGVEWDRYRLTVTNRSSFPASMFAAAPDLPPCGSNTNSSQSWVDIYSGRTNDRIYGFCALSSPDELNDIWFAVPRWTQPPPSVYITITDRRANVMYTSNTISLFGPLFVNSPRQVELNWSTVDGAASYEIEMQYCESWASPDWRTCNRDWQPWTHLMSYTGGASYIDTFVGDQPGRWRVRANDAGGNPISSFTEYKYFTYITGPGAP